MQYALRFRHNGFLVQKSGYSHHFMHVDHHIGNGNYYTAIIPDLKNAKTQRTRLQNEIGGDVRIDVVEVIEVLTGRVAG